SPSGAVALTAPTTINSLKDATVSGNTTLTINSGMILSTGTVLSNISVSTLALGKGFVHNATIASVISGTSLMVSGTVNLSGQNAYTGPTIVNLGFLSNLGNEVIPDTSIVYLNKLIDINTGGAASSSQ